MKYLYGIVAVIFLMFATACQNDPIEKDEDQPTHTLLIYMAGDNTLTEECSTNLKLIKLGILSSDEDMNVIIFKDNRDSGDALPTLFQLKKDKGTKDKNTGKITYGIDTIYIQQYTAEANSVDPTFIKNVVNTVFSLYDTDIKGFEFWSHALSWIPSGDYSATSSNSYFDKNIEMRFSEGDGPSFTRATKYIGQDDNKSLELWNLRKVFEQCPHMDYMLFDACFMGMAEVAYELQDVTDYIFAPINEIMGAGFPYASMIPALSECTEKKELESSLIKLVDAYSTYYATDGTCTLLKTENADKLASAVAKLRKAVPAKLKDLTTSPYIYEAEMQHYGRVKVGSRYYFYEFQDYIDFLSKDGSADVQNIVSEIDKNNIIVDYFSSSTFIVSGQTEQLDLSGCKGLGISIPEFFGITGSKARLDAAYLETKWGQAMQ